MRSMPGATRTRWMRWPSAGSATPSSSYGELTGSGKDKLTFDQVAIDKATAYAAEDADVIAAAVAAC